MRHICSICGRGMNCCCGNPCGYPKEYPMNCRTESGKTIHEEEYLKTRRFS